MWLEWINVINIWNLRIVYIGFALKLQVRTYIQGRSYLASSE